jgi:hypothetical protein
MANNQALGLEALITFYTYFKNRYLYSFFFKGKVACSRKRILEPELPGRRDHNLFEFSLKKIFLLIYQMPKPK